MKSLPVKVKYEGELEGINANTLLVSLLGYVGLLEEVQKELNIAKKLNIYINATKTGSFIVDLNLVLDTIDKIKALFNENITLNDLKSIVEIAVILIALKTFLKGEKPKEVKEDNGKVVIVNSNGNSIEINRNVYKIAKSSELIDENIKRLAEPLINDDSIEGLEIESLNKKFKVEREDFNYLAKTSPLLEEKTREIIKRKVSLAVVKVVFAENRKWEFIFEGNKISAYILDLEFLNKLDEFSFKKGTKIICDLKILQVYDYKLQEYINDEFYIIKVYEVKNPAENKSLF